MVVKLSKQKMKNLVLLQIIPDQCWICADNPNLYYAKLGDKIILYCPVCKCMSPVEKQESIDRIKDEFDYIFLSKEEYHKKMFGDDDTE